jgi:hypothetical protein
MLSSLSSTIITFFGIDFPFQPPEPTGQASPQRL